MSEEAVGYGRPPVAHQWQPGQSGNPAGREAGVPNRATVLKRLLALEYEIDDPLNEGAKLKVTVEEAVTWGVVQKAVSGDVQAYKEIMDSLHGKQTEKHEVETKRVITRRIGGHSKPEDGSPGA